MHKWSEDQSEKKEGKKQEWSVKVSNSNFHLREGKYPKNQKNKGRQQGEESEVIRHLIQRVAVVLA